MTNSLYRQRLVLQLLSKTSRTKSTAAQGFTLIELLVVIVILGVLGAVGYPVYINQVQRANEAAAQNAAMAAAKSCAALQVTGDIDSFDPGSDVVTPTACPTGAETFNATFGAGNTLGTGGAEITVDGAVRAL